MHFRYHISKAFQVAYCFSPNISVLVIDRAVCGGAGTLVQQGAGLAPVFCGLPKTSSSIAISVLWFQSFPALSPASSASVRSAPAQGILQHLQVCPKSEFWVLRGTAEEPACVRDLGPKAPQ